MNTAQSGGIWTVGNCRRPDLASQPPCRSSVHSSLWQWVISRGMPCSPHPSPGAGICWGSCELGVSSPAQAPGCQLGADEARKSPVLGFAGADGSSSSGNSNPSPAQHSLPAYSNLPLSTPINKSLTGEPKGLTQAGSSPSCTYLWATTSCSHILHWGERASPLHQAQRNRRWSHSLPYFSMNKTRSAVPPTLSQFTSCPAPHILHIQAASGRIKRSSKQGRKKTEETPPYLQV